VARVCEVLRTTNFYAQAATRWGTGDLFFVRSKGAKKRERDGRGPKFGTPAMARVGPSKYEELLGGGGITQRNFSSRHETMYWKRTQSRELAIKESVRRRWKGSEARQGLGSQKG